MMMRKFLLNLFVFSLIFLVFSSILSQLFERTIMRDSMLLRTEHHFLKDSEPLLFLFMGDSHTKDGINPDYIPQSFNFSTTKQSYIQTYYTLKSLLESHSRTDSLQMIFLPCDLTTFGSYRLRNFDPSFYWDRYLDFWEVGQTLDDRPRFLWKQLEASTMSYLNNGSYIIEYVGWRWFGGGKVKPQLNGHTPQPGDFSLISDQDSFSRDRVQRLFGEGQLVDPHLADYFARTVELCHAHDLPVVLLNFPLVRAYELAIKEYYPDWQEQMQTVEHIVNTPGVILLTELTNDMSETPRWFHDPGHLNSGGAIELSTRIKSWIENQIPLE